MLLPRGATHTLADDHASPTITLERLVGEAPLDGRRWLRYGGTGAVTRLLCGSFSRADGVPDSTLAVLPDVVRVDNETAPAIAWIEPVLAALNSEADAACQVQPRSGPRSPTSSSLRRFVRG